MTIRMILTTTALSLALPVSAQDFERGERNTDLQPAFDAQFRAPLEDSGVTPATETIAEGLEHPWGIAVLPEGGYLVTERPGRLRHVSDDGALSDPLDGVPEVVAEEQGGLLDVALAPDFDQTRHVFLTYAKPVGDGLSATAAGFGTLSEDMGALTDFTDIFVQEPGSTVPMHFGSRIVFDDDGHAFITTGEHFTEEYRVYAQDLDKTYGKVIRVNRDGSVPEDNPFAGQAGAVDTIWSYGHRNVQGAAMVDGELWTIEHGPAGGDELNRPEAGLNYGWPVVTHGQNYDGSTVGTGEAQAEGMEQPVYFWDPVIAPSGMIHYDGSVFEAWQGDLLIGSLTPGGIVRLSLEDGEVAAEERLLTDLGRVRDLEVGPDGAIVAIIDAADAPLLRITPEDG